MKTLVSILALAVVAGPSLEAQDNFKDGQDLTGTWRIRFSTNGELRSLATFTADGGAIITHGMPHIFPTEHGVWVRTGLRSFIVRSTSLRFESYSQAVIGTTETVIQLEISQDGRSASGLIKRSNFDFDGNLIADFGTASWNATRLVP